MAEKFGVVRRHGNRLSVHECGQVFELFAPLGQKVFRVGFRFCFRPFGYVGFLVITFAGNPEIFDAGVHADAIGKNVRPQVLQIEIVPDVPVEFTVIVISRIAFSGTPYLARRIWVPPKRRNT